MRNVLSRLPRWAVRISSVLAVIALFGLIQLLPMAKDHPNPPVIREPPWDSSQTRELVKRACFDCHSNETVWPWYSNIAPVSWVVEEDVLEARAALNFSEWTPITNLKPGEIGAILDESEMPPGIYLLAHPEARLTMDELQKLTDGLDKSLTP